MRSGRRRRSPSGRRGPRRRHRSPPRRPRTGSSAAAPPTARRDRNARPCRGRSEELPEAAAVRGDRGRTDYGPHVHDVRVPRTVIGSVPLHSTTVFSPNGNRILRVVAPNRDATSRPSSHATSSCSITAAIVLRVPVEPKPLTDTRRRSRRAAVDLLRREPSRQVARDVVEAERRNHDHSRRGRRLREPLVHERDERLLAGRVEVVRALGDRGLDRREPELEERPGARGDDGRAGECLAQCFERARVGDAHFLAGTRERFESLLPATDEPHRQTRAARPVEHEPARVPGHAEDGQRHRRECTVARGDRAKTFSYAVSLDRDWTGTSDRGGPPLPDEEGWTPEHLLLAGLARCTLTSLRYHAQPRGIGTTGAADARGTVTHRDEDGRYAFVDLEVELDVTFEPPPAERARAALEGRARLLRRRLADRDAALLAGSSTERRSGEHDPARRRSRAAALLRAAAHARVLRRAGRDAVPRRGDRRDRRLPARGQREHRRALRDERAHRRADRARAGGRGPLPQLPSGRGRVRPEHDLAQLPAHARARADAARRATRSSARGSTTTPTSRRGSSSRTTSASSSASRA